MDQRVIRISNPAGWTYSPRGILTNYPQGDYTVPEDMDPDTARRCLGSGFGKEVQSKLETKHNNKPAGKKKRSKKKTGKRARSSRQARQ